MIISHKYKFIFIKTRKTAGTSIEVYLSNFCDEQDVFTPIYPEVEGHEARNYGAYFNHVSAAEIRATQKACVWRDYFKFCVERNPWDKTLSYFYMQKVRSGNVLTLEDYFNSQDFCNDYGLYTDPNNSSQIIVDRVLHYEALSQELTGVLSQLGIPFNGDLGVRAKSEYRTDRRPYASVLTPEQARLIEQKFQTEIQLFDYKFS